MRALRIVPLIALSPLACNVFLGLSDFKDDCPAVEQGKACCRQGDVEACAYSGPAGTENQGVCRAGHRECLEDGSGFGDCEGEVVPSAEVCGNTVDENCDGHMDEGCACDEGDTKVCYDADMSLVGKGACKTGLQHCKGGKLEATCEGEVLPAAKEDCQKVGDEDCDGHACADTIFANAYGDEREQHGESVAVAPNGDIVLAGTFTEDIQIENTPLVSDAGGDIFLARFDKNHKLKWAKSLGVNGEFAPAIATDSAGNIYVTGQSTGPQIFSPDSIGSGPIVVAKLDPDGNKVWSRGCGGESKNNNPPFIAVTANGHVLISGVVNGQAKCITNFGAAGQKAAFVASFADDGTPLWNTAVGGSLTKIAVAGMTPNVNGAAWITGSFTGTFNGNASVDGLDAFIQRIETDGTKGPGYAIGDGGDQTALGLDVDASGHPLVLFHNTGTIHLSSSNKPTTTSAELVLVGMDPSGSINWDKEWDNVPTDVGDIGAAIHYDPTGDIILAGFSAGVGIDFGGKVTPEISWLTKVDKRGAFIWERGYGGTPMQSGDDINAILPSAIALTSGRDIVLGGTVVGTIDFGGGIKVTDRKFDAILFEVGY